MNKPTLTEIINLENYDEGEITHYSGTSRAFLDTWQGSQGATQPLSFNTLVTLWILKQVKAQLFTELDLLEFMAIARKQGAYPVSERITTEVLDGFIATQTTAVFMPRDVAHSYFAELFTRIEWENGLPVTFFPAPHHRGIAIDPRINFGRPYLVNTGTPTEVLHSCFNAGDDIDDLAADYECQKRDVIRAIQFHNSNK